MSALLLLVLALGVAGGIVIGRETGGSARTGELDSDVDAVTDVLVNNYYYRPIDSDSQDAFEESLEIHAISGMLLSLDDQYTRYLPPEDAQIATEQLEGEYGGIGVTLETNAGVTSVARVGPDSPASRAGIQAGDILVRIDNRPTSSVAESLTGLDLRGPVGSNVEVTIQHLTAQQPKTIVVERESIVVHPVSWEMIDGTPYMRISIDIFGDRTVEELERALGAAKDLGVEGIVLDLRGNGGGWVASAQETIGRFLDDDVGPAMYEDESPGPGDPSSYPILNDEGSVSGLPLIVLVDSETASAAEIVAGALRDYDRAIIVGERTLGKGSVQRIFDFDDGASLRVTVAEWFTPSRARIQGEGVRPDVLVAPGLSGAAQAGDAYIVTAIQLLEQGTSRPTQLAQAQTLSTPVATP